MPSIRRAGQSGEASFSTAAVLAGKSGHHPNRIVVLVVVALVSLGLAACGDDSDDDEAIASNTPEATGEDDANQLKSIQI